ncbi:MAG: hypothetical protein ACREIB_01755, partial [Pseudomonadota bacterium]
MIHDIADGGFKRTVTGNVLGLVEGPLLLQRHGDLAAEHRKPLVDRGHSLPGLTFVAVDPHQQAMQGFIVQMLGRRLIGPEG